MIKGAESVRAMNPSLAAVTSGASAGLMLTAGVALGDALPAGLEPALEVVEPELQPWARRVPAAVAPAVMMNFLLERLLMVLDLLVNYETIREIMRDAGLPARVPHLAV
jgi:hypothetical protein